MISELTPTRLKNRPTLGRNSTASTTPTMVNKASFATQQLLYLELIVGCCVRLRGFQRRSVKGLDSTGAGTEWGGSIVRLNTKDGGTRLIESDPSEWTFPADGDDIAALQIYPNGTTDDLSAVDEQMFVNRSVIKDREIDLGEDAFMIGLFEPHDGGDKNIPKGRFGNISMIANPAAPVRQENGFERESHIIDMRSRAGFSGSPVFVYRTPGTNFASDMIDIHERFMCLLGIHWGQFPEYWEVTTKKDREKAADAGLITEGQYIKGVSGMTCVCPAWQILELLDAEEFVKERAMDDQQLLNQEIDNGPNAEGE